MFFKWGICNFPFILLQAEVLLVDIIVLCGMVILDDLSLGSLSCCYCLLLVSRHILVCDNSVGSHILSHRIIDSHLRNCSTRHNTPFELSNSSCWFALFNILQWTWLAFTLVSYCLILAPYSLQMAIQLLENGYHSHWVCLPSDTITIGIFVIMLSNYNYFIIIVKYCEL